MKQEINFRSTTGYRSDDSVDAHVETSTVVNYPTVSAQGNTVGWEISVAGANAFNLSTSLDARLAGVSGNPDTSVRIYRIDLPSPGTYRLRCAAGADGARVVYLRALDDVSLVATLVPPQLSPGAFIYLDATGVARAGADWPAMNSYIDINMSTATLKFTNGGVDVAGSTYAYIAHLSVESVAPPSGVTPVILRNHYMNQGWA